MEILTSDSIKCPTLKAQVKDMEKWIHQYCPKAQLTTTPYSQGRWNVSIIKGNVIKPLIGSYSLDEMRLFLIATFTADDTIEKLKRNAD